MLNRIALLACLAGAALPTASAQPPVPFSVEVVEVPASNSPALHSAAYGQVGGSWLFVTGRSNGLHGLTATPDPFPAQFANGEIVVYSLSGDARWSASLASLPPDIAAPLRSVNAEFVQVANKLYVVGGYGRNAAGDNVTHPTLTVIDLPAMIAAVQNGTAIAPHIRQVVDQRMAVAGGHLVWRENGQRFQLIGGNRFDGDYLGGNQVQVYTEAVRTFSITDDGSTLAIANYSEDSDPTNLHRRDANVGHTILPGGEESVTLYGGVFNNFNLPFRTPVQVDLGGHSTGTFEARFGHYTCPVLAMHDSRDASMHTVFFGGMGQFWFNEATGQVEEDFLVPFIDDVVALSRTSAGVYWETVLGARMPGYYGTNSQFFAAAGLPATAHGVIHLDQLTQRTLVGHVHGGITTEMAHPGWMSGPSSASSKVFAIYVTPEPVATEGGPESRELALSAPSPNPTAGVATLTLRTARAGEVHVEVFDAVGRRVATVRDGTLAAGEHPLTIDASSLAPGLYVVRAATAGAAAVRRLAVAPVTR